MLERTSLNFVNKTLKDNKDWKILDIGCGYTANTYATAIADVQDLSEFYKGRKFIKITEDKLPFKDNEFNFVIASHVIEHVENFEFFISELERISKKGYIELPTKLGDNLIFENTTDHIWWFNYDDLKKKLIASKRNQLIEPFMSVSTGKKLEKFFRDSFVLELIWNDKIDYEIDANNEFINSKKITFLKLVKKYFSKKIRKLLKK